MRGITNIPEDIKVYSPVRVHVENVPSSSMLPVLWAVIRVNTGKYKNTINIKLYLLWT